MTRTILHLGAHRTASTSIQQALEARQTALNEDGIVAITSMQMRTVLFDPFQKYLAATGSEKDLLKERIQAIISAIYETPNIKTVIFSEENLIGSMNENFFDGKFYEDAPKRVKAFVQFLPKDFEIVLCIRDYASYYTSVFSYMYCKSLFDPFEHYKPRLLAMQFGWFGLIQQLRSTFPKTKITVVRFEHYRAVQQRFFNILGIGPEYKMPQRKLNQSRNDAAIRRLQEALESGATMSREYVTEIVSGSRGEVEAPLELWTKAEQDLLARRYYQHIRKIKRGLSVEYAAILPRKKARKKETPNDQ